MKRSKAECTESPEPPEEGDAVIEQWSLTMMTRDYLSEERASQVKLRGKANLAKRSLASRLRAILPQLIYEAKELSKPFDKREPKQLDYPLADLLRAGPEQLAAKCGKYFNMKLGPLLMAMLEQDKLLLKPEAVTALLKRNGLL